MSTYSPGFAVVRAVAEIEARAADFDAIRPEHLWMALTKLSELSDEDLAQLVVVGGRDAATLKSEVQGLRQWMEQTGIEPTRSRRQLRSRIGRGRGSGRHMHRSPDSRSLIELALKQAGKEGASDAQLTHLAQAIVQDPPPALAHLLADGSPVHSDSADRRRAGAGILDRLGRDLTAEAAEGLLEPLIGRQEEVRQVLEALSRKRRRNVMLVGDPGVGKTCLVEAIAQRIASGTCPAAFRDKRVVSLLMASIVAGTKHRGELEERMQAIIKEAESDTRLILFMDEFHTVMGNEGLAPGVDNIIKPALARGKLQLIGATTVYEYQRYVAKDEALTRRFQLVWIEEPSRDEAIEIVNGAKSGLEQHHGLTITPEAAEAAVDLSLRYLPDQKLPDKALDLLDQTCASRVFSALSMRTDQGQEVSVTVHDGKGAVRREHVARALSKRIQVPVDLIVATDLQRLETLSHHLEQRVIGQSAAIRAVSESLQSAYRGLRDPRRPIASFLFAGPTGVGKTETACGLADALFGAEESFIRIDLSEYMEKHQVARLLGAPPGYVGFNEPGVLTQRLHRRPASVVLFDEVEKAHPDVLDVLLQILDDGHLTDGQGRKASFREAVVILTTNITDEHGARRPIGFASYEDVDGAEMKHDRLMAALRNHLRPELLGRLNNIVLFEPLQPPYLRRIADKVLSQIAKRLESQSLVVPETLREEILSAVADSGFGARDVERLVESKVAGWLKNAFRGPPETSFSQLRMEGGRTDRILVSASLPAKESQAALLALDLVQSTPLLLAKGDTFLRNLVEDVRRAAEEHASASELLYLQCAGDGFLLVYGSVAAAFAMAKSFVAGNPQLEGDVRVALHWGTVRTGAGGRLLGDEVHKALSIQSVAAEDRVSMSGTDPRIGLPDAGRIVASAQALELLSPEEQALFLPAGPHRLKGSNEPCELWAAPASRLWTTGMPGKPAGA